MRKVLKHERLGGGARQRKAEAARSEQEDTQTLELKALFASNERVK